MHTETTKLLESSRSLKYPEPLSTSWRLFHFINYIIGGTTFFFGSICYLPSLNPNYVLGGWLFTIGSSTFLMADLNEWWKNNRVGCYDYEDYEESYEAELGKKHFGDKNTSQGRYKRAENGMNFALSATGSFLYLVGSILFIPSLDAILWGTIVFIPGSLIIFLSQSWKLYRSACFRDNDPNDKSFSVSNWGHDVSGFLIDLNAGLGGFFYMIGSILFLPLYAQYFAAAVWFILGGAAFTLSGICMCYRYFATTNYPH